MTRRSRWLRCRPTWAGTRPFLYDVDIEITVGKCRGIRANTAMCGSTVLPMISMLAMPSAKPRWDGSPGAPRRIAPLYHRKNDDVGADRRIRPRRGPSNHNVVSSKERRCGGSYPPRTPSNDDGGGAAMRTALSTKPDVPAHDAIDRIPMPIIKHLPLPRDVIDRISMPISCISPSPAVRERGPGGEGHLDTPMPSAIMRLPVPV
jgi:hypothetical protein